METTAYEHILLDGRGVPVINGTTMKVVELVTEAIAYGWSPDDLYFQHPYLSLGQIHSALAYYWDHSEDLNRDMEQRSELIDKIRQAAGPSPLAERLRAKGLI
jgi:uncharacterized protein (DUF433 family)